MKKLTTNTKPFISILNNTSPEILCYAFCIFFDKSLFFIRSRHVIFLVIDVYCNGEMCCEEEKKGKHSRKFKSKHTQNILVGIKTEKI